MKLSCKLCRVTNCPQGPSTHWHVRDQYIGVIFTASSQIVCWEWIHKVFLPMFHDARRKREEKAGIVTPPPAPAPPRVKAVVQQIVPEPVPVPAAPPNPAIEEVVSALVNLRMGQAQAKKLVAEVALTHPTAEFEELFKACMSSKAK
jgi:hypothetical protein